MAKVVKNINQDEESEGGVRELNISSSWIDGATYDEDSGVLTVCIGGREYEHNVTPDTAEAFENAPSAGAFYNYFLK